MNRQRRGVGGVGGVAGHGSRHGPLFKNPTKNRVEWHTHQVSEHDTFNLGGVGGVGDLRGCLSKIGFGDDLAESAKTAESEVLRKAHENRAVRQHRGVVTANSESWRSRYCHLGCQKIGRDAPACGVILF